MRAEVQPVTSGDARFILPSPDEVYEIAMRHSARIKAEADAETAKAIPPDQQKLDLDTLEARAKGALALAEKATPGKWQRDVAQDGEMLPDGTGYAGDYYDTNDVVRFVDEYKNPLDYPQEIACAFTPGDAALIAGARSGMPELADAVLALCAEVRRLRGER